MGFSWQPGRDYFDIYSPVIQMESLRVLLAIPANLDWEAKQMDTVGTYLNGKLKEAIYMCKPIGFMDYHSHTYQNPMYIVTYLPPDVHIVTCTLHHMYIATYKTPRHTGMVEGLTIRAR